MIIGTGIKCRHFKLTDKYNDERAHDFAGYDDVLKPITTNWNNPILQIVTTENNILSQSVNSSQHSSQHNDTEKEIQRKSAPAKTSKTDANEIEERFKKFWAAYPKKVGKEIAHRAFLKLKPTDDDLNVWLQAIEAHKQSRQWRDPQYIPYPATWLNQKRWEDAPELTARPSIEYQHDDDLSFFK